MVFGDRMRTSRSAPALLLGFGMLIGLIAVSDLIARRRASETYREISSMNERYRRTERNLDAIASGIYSAGLLARDYLLDHSSESAEEFRSQLMSERTAAEAEFRELKAISREEDKPRLEQLRREVEGYWNALGLLFQWTAEKRRAQSWSFLRHNVLPRRRAALSITLEVAKLTQANLHLQQLEIDRKHASMDVFNRRMLVFTLLVGVGIAGVAVIRITKLEQSENHQRQRSEAAEEELRRLSRQLVQALENERKSISRELHDEVGQMLTALRMELRSMQDLRSAPETDFTEHLEDARRLAEQSLRALRDMAMGLRPSMLDDLGLGSAIQWQARQFSKHTGIPVNTTIERTTVDLPEQHRTCIYRFVQEALTNCARHANAKTIQVILSAEDGHVAIVVRDDGMGFDTSAVRGKGLGLIGLQERVRELGGEIRLTSELHRGTTVSANIPVVIEEKQNEYSHSSGG